MVRGDDEVLEITGPMLDGLYEYHRRALLLVVLTAPRQAVNV